MYTREEFEQLRIASAAEMSADTALKKDALDILMRADHYRWIHQTTWMGEPVLNLPQDLFALQEIIFATRPQYIVEVGVAWGGSLLFTRCCSRCWGVRRLSASTSTCPMI